MIRHHNETVVDLYIFQKYIIAELFLLNRARSLRKRVAIGTEDLAMVPEIFSSHFQNPNTVPLNSVTVCNGLYRYMVVGYYDEALSVNRALKHVRTRITWRGEVALLSLGQYVPVLSKPVGSRVAIRRVVGM